MWIFLGIIFFILLLITIILLLPVSFIIKTDQDGDFVVLYKILFKTFGENPNPDKPIVKALKNISGVTRLDKDKIKESSKKGELLTTLRENFSLIIGLLKKLLGLLKKCKVKVLKIDIICAEEDAAKTAISYGLCYAVISPILNLIHSSMKVKKSGEKITIKSDFDSQKSSFKFETVLVSRVFRIVAALLSLIFEEAKRIAESKTIPIKKKSSDFANKLNEEK